MLIFNRYNYYIKRIVLYKNNIKYNNGVPYMCFIHYRLKNEKG